MSPHIVMGILIGAGLVEMVLGLILFPLVFWIFVVPGIESRIGKKLNFSYSALPFGKYFCGYMELAFTITLMYLSLKIFKDKLKIKFDHFALVNAKYDVSMAPRSELVISFLGFANMIFFLILMLLMFLIPIMYPPH